MHKTYSYSILFIGKTLKRHFQMQIYNYFFILANILLKKLAFQ